jgi:hypothetical protein
MKSILRLVACFAWTGVALSAAAPVHAQVITNQTGFYAHCSSNSTAAPWMSGCLINGEWAEIEAFYTQTIKFVGAACNSGGCEPGDTTCRTDSVYPVGRHTASFTGSCGGKRFYDLSTCSC